VLDIIVKLSLAAIIVVTNSLSSNKGIILCLVFTTVYNKISKYY
jgi:hypothetical protein